MGVYHLMGLGKSIGSVTAPISYLEHRYSRWDTDDKNFFGRSGEREQRLREEKVGDIQGLIFFTTKEIISGEMKSFDFEDNQFGSFTGSSIAKAPMQESLERWLPKVMEELRKGRNPIDTYWVEVDRYNIQVSYERITRTVHALSSVGSKGKEMWANLTGGTNTINFALQLASVLSGKIARLYYAQTPTGTEKCIRCPQEKNYWIELPLLPLNLTPLGIDAIQLVEQNPGIQLSRLKSRLEGIHWKELKNKDLKQDFLSTLWKQGLITVDGENFFVGPQWKPIKVYVEMLEQVRIDQRTLKDLSKEESWIAHVPIAMF